MIDKGLAKVLAVLRSRRATATERAPESSRHHQPNLAVGIAFGLHPRLGRTTPPGHINEMPTTLPMHRLSVRTESTGNARAYPIF